MKTKIILILCLGGIMLGACSHPTCLEGTWVGFDIRNPLIDWTLKIDGNQFYLSCEDLFIWYAGQFNLNNNCILKKIDLDVSSTPIDDHKETTLLGIYEIDGNTLTLITGKSANSLRPASFDDPVSAVVFSFVRS